MAALLWTAPAAAAVKNPDTFVYAIVGEADSLDPAWHYDGISHEVLFQTYETLIFFAGAAVDRFEPMLATSVPSRENGLLSADGLTYTFPLRAGVKFHDGRLMTPEDVRYSLQRFLLLDRVGGPSTLLLEPLLGRYSVRGPDGRPAPGIYKEVQDAVRLEGGALVLRLKNPSPVLLSVLAAHCPITSKAFTIAGGGWDGNEASWVSKMNPAKKDSALYDRSNGTGPFKLERWDKTARVVILSRHEGYWRKPAALKYVVFKTVPEAGARKQMLQAGDADAAYVERQNLPQYAGLPGVRIVDDLPFLEVSNVFIPSFKLSMEDNPYVGSGKLGGGIPANFFADLDVRKAMAYAFDYDAYIRDGYRGKAVRARGPIPRGLPGYNARQKPWPHDLAKAAAHFKKAFQGRVWEEGFRFTVVYLEGRSDRQLACAILKSRVEALNPKFKIDILAMPWSEISQKNQKGSIPLSPSRWSLDIADAHNGAQPFLHSQGHYGQRQGYHNPKADALIEEAWAQRDPAKRQALYARLQALAQEDLPQFYTVDSYNLQVRRTWVKGWYYNPMVVHGYLYPVSKR